MVPQSATKQGQRLNRLDLVLTLVFGLGAIGMAVYGLGLIGYLKLNQTVAAIAIICLGMLWSIRKKLAWPQPTASTLTQKIILTLISLQWLVYVLGVGVPDTSFDAVWYHLPEAHIYATTGHITRIPDILYSTLPRLGEMYLALGFLFGGAALVRLITFVFALLFILLSYALARQFLPKTDSLILAAVTNSMFAIAWQSTAGYVDIITAVFLLSSLLCLIRYSNTRLLLAGMFAGFALGTKMQAIIAMPAALAFLAVSSKENIKTRIMHMAYYILLAVLVAAPWYMDNYLQTGSLLYPLNQPFKQQDQLQYSGAASIKDWIINQIIRLPTTPIHLALKDLQMTPVIILLLPLLIIKHKSLITHHKHLLLYTCCFLLFWWLLPPPEPRYALAAIPPLLTLLFLTTNHLTISLRRILYVTTLVLIGLNLLVRLGVTYHRLSVITGRQSPIDYINAQKTNFNHDKIEKFYR